LWRKPSVDWPYLDIVAICAIVGGKLSDQVFSALRFSIAVAVAACATAVSPQQSAPAPKPAPAIVQPGAPGTSNKVLSPAAATASEAPKPPSKADADFMQGMIMHHNQAVEMTELLKSRTKDSARSTFPKPTKCAG